MFDETSLQRAKRLAGATTAEAVGLLVTGAMSPEMFQAWLKERERRRDSRREKGGRPKRSRRRSSGVKSDSRVSRNWPVRMDEIQAAHPTLAWRSSVRYTIQALVDDGRVIETDEPGTARRYRAVAEREGTDLHAEVGDMPASAPVMVVPLER